MLAIDHNSCLSCAGCIGVCPEMALFQDLSSLKVDYMLCNLCALCVKFCPLQALSIDGHPKGRKTSGN